MCCEPGMHSGKSSGHSDACGCGGPACFGPAFWSKRKKIQMVEDSLGSLRERIKDLEELLKELKEEKK